MLRVTPRQFDLPGQFPDSAKDGDVQSTPRATTTPLSAAATQRTTAQPSAETTQKDTATTRTTHGVHGTTTTRITVSRPKNAGSISASSSTSLPASTSPSHASATITTEVITVSREPIVLTTFGPDFPIPTQPRAASSRPGRGYVFIESSEIADAMLLFAVFCGVCFAFTFLLINLTRLSERRRGVTKEDQMLGEDMRWAEGREVVEKRIVWRSENGRTPRPAGSKLARRQSWGDRKR